MRRLGILAGWAVVVTPFLLEALTIVRASQEWLVQRTPDDAFYYLEIARQIDHGHGFSFDGIHATNGFHPLWQYLLAGVGLAVPGSTAFIRADLLAGLACAFAAVVLMIRLVWRWLGPGPALLGAALAVHGGSAMGTYADGMEGALSVLCLVLLATAMVWYFESPSFRRAAVVGAVSAALVLARLDMAAVIWLVPLAMVWRARTWRPAAGWAVGGLVGVPWAIWYWIRYHHILTTSATIKQQMVAGTVRGDGGRFSRTYLDYLMRIARSCVQSVIDLTRDSPLREATRGGLALSLVLFGLAVVGAVWLVRQRGEAEPGSTATPTQAAATAWTFGVLVVLLVVKFLVDLVTATPWIQGWYLTPQRFVFPFLIGMLAWLGATRVRQRSRRAGVVAVACLCLFALPLQGSQLSSSASSRVDADSWQGQIDLADGWVVAHGPPGRYGAFDAGLTGYRLDQLHPVVDLDGLANDYRYDQLANRGASIRQELAATGVDVLVQRLQPDQLRQLSCGTVLWTSPGTVTSTGLAGTTADAAPIYVVDVRGCRP